MNACDINEFVYIGIINWDECMWYKWICLHWDNKCEEK